jgi:hypothetical protein
MMRDIDETTKADALLTEHYYWQKSYREKLGYGNAAPECRQSRSSRQWDSTAEIVDEAVAHLEMEAVDWCMDAATPECRQAIGKEMRNREAGAKVWRSPSPMTYSEALDMIVPMMKKKDLI